MVLRYKDITNDGVSIEQVTSRPTIYLDQWTWCLLSEDSTLRNRFIKTAAEANATIMYSLATIIELALIKDSKQIEAVHDVMDNLDYGFSDSHILRVIKKEDELSITGGGTFYDLNHCCDHELIGNYFRNIMNPLKPFQLSAILPIVKNDEESGKFRKMGQKSEDITQIVHKCRKDPVELSRAKERHTKKELFRKQKPYTKDVYRLAIDFVVVNETMKMSSQEWYDFLHVVVPVSYFDFVTLDKKWCHFIREIFPLSPPDIARVFSQREIDNFLTKINDFDIKTVS